MKTHAVEPETVFVVVLVSPAPASVTVPGSPEPSWSPSVSCQGAGPSSKLAPAPVALKVTAPAGTHAVCVAAAEGVPPAIETEHHAR